jgi:hypothetical protein
MANIHISPSMIAIMANNATTIEELQKLIELVKNTAHPYQIGWLQGKIEQMKHQENKS